MSELVNTRENRKTFRSRLLVTASALALIGCVYVAGKARASDDDGSHPLVWIELGGQLSRLDDAQEDYSPHFLSGRPSIFEPSQPFEKPPQDSIDEFGALSFQPDDSDWVFSASIRYGRSGAKRHVHQQTYPKPLIQYYYGYGSSNATHVLKSFRQTRAVEKFADTLVNIDESHSVVDFQAGKDVGLGMFGGKSGSSVLSAGVRFAQFNSRSNIALKSNPDDHPEYRYLGFKTPVHNTSARFLIGGTYHSYVAMLTASRSFHGIGPSLSWNASKSFMGNTKDGELAVDWGVNAAVLFGRQRTKVHHQTTAGYRHGYYPKLGGVPSGIRLYQNVPPDSIRSRTVTVPNIGGFAGLSFHYVDAKISLGYRADLFFGPMDGGIDTAKKENRSFYGPFASVSIGIP